MRTIQTSLKSLLEESRVRLFKDRKTDKAFEDYKTQINALYNNKRSVAEVNISANFKRFIEDAYSSYSVLLDEDYIDLKVNAGDKAIAIFEFKTANSPEMIKLDQFNKKAFHELILNFISLYDKGQYVKWLIITDGKVFYVFPSSFFVRAFASNSNFRKYAGLDVNSLMYGVGKRDVTYNLIKTYIEQTNFGEPLYYTYFNINEEGIDDYVKTFFSPGVFANNKQSATSGLNEKFYKELLHIMGLVEKNGNIIANNVSGSFYEQIKEKLGTADREQILEVLIIWFNRILFLKLFESRLYSFNGKNPQFLFMNKEKIPDFATLNDLFFYVLAAPEKDRTDSLKQKFGNIPYLNSSLFEERDIEQKIKISNIRNEYIQYYKDTVLEKKSEKIPLLDYLLEFLDAYDFGKEEKEDNLLESDLISPAVLGLVFEKINGYKDGSYYTPNEIADYIAEESIAKSFISAVNAKAQTNFTEIFQIEESLAKGYLDRKIVEDVLDSLKICDPAVGSGHFLVASLNFLLDLRLRFNMFKGVDPEFIQRSGFSLVRYPHDVVFKKKDEVFAYKVDADDVAKKFQKAVFETKRFVIENNLFGVDINPKAVEIARLRLWIELLKNAYYRDDSTMETLPNIDINIHIGDSILAPVVDRSSGLFENSLIPRYKRLIKEYQEVTSKKEKAEKLEEIQKTRETLSSGLNSSYKEFIWTIDFPQMLDDSGNFVGFDVVLGNPPYIPLQENSGYLGKLYENLGFKTFVRTGDIYCLFYEKGIQLLKDGGVLAYITSNKWMRAGYGRYLRSFLLSYSPYLILDIGPGVFENATVDTGIVFVKKEKAQQIVCKGNILSKDRIKEIRKVAEQAFELSYLNNYASSANGELQWFIGDSNEYNLKQKIERIGKPLKDWDVKIYYGIKTGLNEAFIIDSKKREEILNNCKNEEERKRTEAIIKPILRGRDIGRYYYEWKGLWVIVIPAGWTNENRGYKDAEIFIKEQFSSLMTYLQSFEEKAKKRDDQGDYWWELRHCSYYPEFEKEKVVWQEIVQEPSFFYDSNKFYIEATGFIMTGERMKYLCGILNSKPCAFFFKNWYSVDLGGKGFRYKKEYIVKLPIPPITTNNEHTVKQIESLVDLILDAKKKNKNADTTEYERQIDELVYELYGLDDQEIKLIEGLT
ncbi:MAG: TaqI-like C-terminal specificity domain-containing protein [archaeon]